MRFNDLKETDKAVIVGHIMIFKCYHANSDKGSRSDIHTFLSAKNLIINFVPPLCEYDVHNPRVDCISDADYESMLEAFGITTA